MSSNVLTWNPERVHAALGDTRRVLLVGEAGTGKSAFAALAADTLAASRPIWCIDADPGSPAIGPPGAISLGRWQEGAWLAEGFEPLCSLDAARFRLPLVRSVHALADVPTSGTTLIDTPGFVTGMAGAELIESLIHMLAPDLIVAIHPPGSPLPLAAELMSSQRCVVQLAAPPEAKSASAGARARMRTVAWDRFLESGTETSLDLAGLNQLGAPPPPEAEEAWQGRQVAVGCSGRWIGFGEVQAIVEGTLSANIVGTTAGADCLLVRDAARGANNELRTARPYAARKPVVKQSSRAPLEIRAGPLLLTLVNGVTGDPLLMARLRYRHDAFMFDVGESHQLSRRVLHTVTRLFLSHAHFDHVAGFPYLLRSRLSAELPPLHIYGPPGTRENIAGFINGVTWDRIGDDGPRLVITEVDGGNVRQSVLQPGGPGGGTVAQHPFDGTLLSTPDLDVSAVMLDHGTPVLAYAIAMTEQLNINGHQLAQLDLEPGAWLGDLKANVQRQTLDSLIQLPDGRETTAGQLQEMLILRTPGPRIVYATDFEDSQANHDRLVAFARHADVLFCEATFRNADAHLASGTQHLTTRACGEIARRANVRRLVPFHFSKRYEGNLGPAYREIEVAGKSVQVVAHALATHTP